MPQLAAISINDGATTPLAHNFTPVTTDGSNAKLSNKSAAMPQGFETLTINVRDVNGSKTAAYRVTGGFVLPTVAAVDGVDTVVRTSQFKFEFDISQLSTAQERKNLRVLASNLFLNALMTSVIEGPEPLY